MSFLVIGAGSWGTAFAIHLAKLHPHRTIYLSSREYHHVEEMQNTRKNQRYLQECVLPSNIQFLLQNDIAALLNKHFIEHIIIAVPSHAFREVLALLKNIFLPDKQKLIWITKGLDPVKHHFLHETAQEMLGKKAILGIISGPSFAKEVAMGLPAAVTFASQDENLVKFFHSTQFRVYYSEDMIGVQLGGAVKNVLAIAVGIAEGLKCGANAQAALITRGLTEMMRLGEACGAQSKTLMGLSGVGDLILTCTNNQSRNRRFGMALGQNQSKEVAEKAIGQVVEGIQTAKEIYALSQWYKIPMPITEQVYKLLYDDLAPSQALKNLLNRDPKKEIL